MKLTGILLLAAVVHVSARGTAQTVTYEAKGTPLSEVFAAIKHQTGYVFFYDLQDLDGTVPVTVKLKGVPLKTALETILAGEPVAFDIQGNTIVITRKAPVVGVNTNNSIALPPGEIHGRITDSLGHPLVGASVSVKGDKHGAQTDQNGDFVLKGVADNATLIISNVGYESQTIKLSGSREVRIALKQSTSELDQTVVKGYYNTTERLNTGDVATIKAEDIQKQPVSDPILALEGRVPGLYIQQSSGIPGAYSQIHIMGQNSIANGNDPLYIIDGVPFSSVSLSSSEIPSGAVGGGGGNYNGAGSGISPFNSLNPNDIESIVVLKDADATAIYGSRGANGVILITTKRGKAGKTKLDLNVYTGNNAVTRMMHLLNTQQYLAMQREAYQNDGLPMPNITTNPSDYNYDVDGVWDTTRNTNWQKVLFGNIAHFTNAQASVSGGDANTQFLVGVGYSKQGTVYIGDYSDQKLMTHLSLNHTSNDQRFHLQLGASYVYDDNNLPQADLTSTAFEMAPDAPSLFVANGNLNYDYVNGAETFYENPAVYLYKSAKSTTNNLISNLDLVYEILPGLKFSSSAGYTEAEMHQLNSSPSFFQPPPYNTNPNERASNYANTLFQTWIVEPKLAYQRTIGSGHVDVLVGGTFEQNTQNSIGISAYGFSSDALLADFAAAPHVTSFNSNSLYKYDAIYGRIGYNWADKYILNFTARRDGSSRFGPGKQFGNFGAGGIGWIFSKENFIDQHRTLLSFGKLRASYGTTGNDQIGNYQYLSTYRASSTTYEGTPGLAPTSLTNPNFAWEVVKKLEGGIDLGFLKDRILVSATYYQNRTGNQLVGEPLPALTGFQSVEFNLPAIVQNTGIELTLNTINLKGKNFTWKSIANLTVPKNKLVAFPGIENYPTYQYRYVVGKSLFINEMFHSTGVNPQTGLYSFDTKNANGFPNYFTEYVPTKAITQKYYGGLDNRFSYKGFELDVFIQYVDQLGYNYKFYYNAQPGKDNSNEPTAVLNRWTAAGNLTSTQRFGTTGTTSTPYSYYSYSDGTITNASFVRFKNVALSYQLPSAWNAKMHLQQARLYIQCQNLFTISPYVGTDPETRGLSLPPMRVITCGLQIDL